VQLEEKFNSSKANLELLTKTKADLASMIPQAPGKAEMA
jgi:hypothetical protein